MFEPQLSIVIPFYNEENRLKESLPQIFSFVQAQPYTCELIFVDDGSYDRSLDVLKAHANEVPFQIIRSIVNEGKGSAVKKGMLAARGKYVLFTDADLSTPLEEVNRFTGYLDKGYDCVIGSRALPQSKIEVRQNPLRELMGKCFNILARFLSFRSIKDSQCGFKCFRNSVAQDLFSSQILMGFAFDAEILFLAQKRGYTIKEEPVLWKNEPQSKVSVLSDPVKMFSDLLKIRWLHRKDKR